MQVCVHVDSARIYRWHLALLAASQAAGHDVVVSFVDTPEPLPTSWTVVMDYDRARSHATSDTMSTHVTGKFLSGVPRYGGGGYDLMIDVSSASRVRTHPGRVIRPLFDGSYKDYALIQSLLEQHAPFLAVANSASRDHIWNIGLPAIEQPWRPARSFDMVTSRLIEGLVDVANRIAAGEGPSNETTPTRNFAGRSSILAAAGVFARKRAKRKFTRLTEKLSGNEAKWHVAWRTIEAGTAPAPGTLLLRSFKILEDDGQRYFADPFLFEHRGVVHVFVEEVPAATGRGIISHFTLSSEGVPSKVTPVLDTGSHLSYPFVIAHEGQIYMLPEASSAGGLDLYRATSFPHKWEKCARLIEGRVHDATPFEHEGRWWMAAGSESLQSSSWDGLSIFAALQLPGPWTPHAGNPVLIDAAAARPAGPLWRDAQGALMRPAQNCTQGYGSSLTLRRITRLDADGFSEETIGAISFAPSAQIAGPHTLGRAGGFEVIDLFARPSVLRAGYRL